MNPTIESLRDDVWELQAIRDEEKRLAVRKAAVQGRLRAKVTAANVEDFRTLYGAIITPVRVAPQVAAMPVSHYADVCRELRTWPLRADVSPSTTQAQAGSILHYCWPNPGKPSRVTITVPTTPILRDNGADMYFVQSLIAVPPPLVADRMRERGDLPAAEYQIDFRCRAMDALAEGDDDDTA